ncbi:MAG: putative PLP-dependent aminotransferase [Polaromonas sp.]|nr:putative PLP-dependent aminotransferase [Polaromonas sp.]
MNLSARDLVGPPCTSKEIEAKLRTLFPSSEPVLFSSARAGLTAVLEVLGLSRPDLIWTPPFSSHCVLEAIAHVCTPIPVVAEVGDIAAALVYHQWGHINQSSFSSNVRIIEDSVDSLLIPGSSPFAIGGDFALWSLPKVLGTQSGGVVFCRHAERASALRALRASRSSSALQAFLRWRSKSSALAATYWNGAEALQGELVMPLRRQALRRLKAIYQVTEERLSLLRHISLDLSRSYERTGRLPSNLPMRLPSEWQHVWGPSGLVSAGLRSFNVARTSPDTNWVRVAPLPVHMDVSRVHLQKIFQHLNLKVSSNEFDIV